MLIIKSQYTGTYTMAKLTEALGGESSVSDQANNYQQQNTQMLNDHSSIQTHTHAHHRRTQLHKHTRQGVLILHAVNPLKAQFWAVSTKRFIKASKKDRAHHPPTPTPSPHPQPHFGKISMGIWNWISCVICIHALSLAIPLILQQAVFIFEQGCKARRWCVCVSLSMCVWDREIERVGMKQLERGNWTSHTPLPSTPPFPPSPPLCQVFHYIAS